jgi:hypothetical protein
MTVSRGDSDGVKGQQEDGEENLALFGQSNKGRGKGPNKGKGKSEESTSQPRKKDLSKIKCFICHKNGHYAYLCRNSDERVCCQVREGFLVGILPFYQCDSKECVVCG